MSSPYPEEETDHAHDPHDEALSDLVPLEWDKFLTLPKIQDTEDATLQ